jgi:hypothetical protein
MMAETASAAVKAFWYTRNSSSLRMIMLNRGAIFVPANA